MISPRLSELGFDAMNATEAYVTLQQASYSCLSCLNLYRSLGCLTSNCGCMQFRNMRESPLQLFNMAASLRFPGNIHVRPISYVGYRLMIGGVSVVD